MTASFSIYIKVKTAERVALMFWAYFYTNTTVPVFMTVMNGVDHTAAARQGLPAITAWLLWHLKGETQRQGDFLNSGSVFRSGIFVSKSKNW